MNISRHLLLINKTDHFKRFVKDTFLLFLDITLVLRDVRPQDVGHQALQAFPLLGAELLQNGALVASTEVTCKYTYAQIVMFIYFIINPFEDIKYTLIH